MSHCFLSYARADAKDPHFEAFLADFLEELRGRLGAHTIDGLAFRDSDSIALGAAWEPSIEKALRTCRIFIAMLSPTYLRRKACSKEWACFEWRLRNLGGAVQPELLLPIVWIPILEEDVPVAVRRLQHTHASLGPTYVARGLLYLVRRGGQEYRDFLSALADRVRDLLRLPALPQPAELLAPGSLPDPFEVGEHTYGIASELRPSAAHHSPRGPRHVEFIVVAAQQTELRTIRRALSAYGTDFDEWCPFLPALDTRVGLLVQKIAIEQNLTASVLPVAQNIIARLQGARAKNTLVVFIVDVWSLQLPTYRSYMNSFDRERFTNAGALVVWNLSDNETLDRKHELVDALLIAFPNLTIMPDPPAFHHQLETPEQLAEKLRATLCELRRRIATFGDVMRKAEGMAPVSKPLLVGPGQP